MSPRRRFAGPYLALATFAIPLSFIGVLKKFQKFTGGSLGKNLPLLHSQLGLGTNPSLWLYIVAWTVALVLFAAAWVLVRGRLGRSLRAVRDSEIASTANGISAMWVKTLAFGLSAFYCGVAGAVFAIGLAYVNPDTFPIDLSILLLTGIVIGGTGSLGGHGLRRALRRVHPHELGAEPRPPLHARDHGAREHATRRARRS